MTNKCDPAEIAVKSFFLGPKAENGTWFKAAVNHIFDKWFNWRKAQYKSDGKAISTEDQNEPEYIQVQNLTEQYVSQLVERFESEIPKFSPRYIGHMFSEVSMPALLGHILTLLHNPNNISFESSKVGVEIEKEAIQMLSEIVGFKAGVGHFTSGGTVANYEFLYRARDRALGQIKLDDMVLIVPSSCHYSWPKACHIFGIKRENLWYMELDKDGRASTESLKKLFVKATEQNKTVIGVVAVAGTTELGTVDPIHKIHLLISEFNKNQILPIWFHVDAAYGGLLRTLIKSKDQSILSTDVVEALAGIQHCDSITLDPHKLGYVPYSAGVFMAKDKEHYFVKSFTGSYIVSNENTLGNYTLEGSRSAAGAVATWLSFKSLSGISGYEKIFSRTLLVKNTLKNRLLKIEKNLNVLFSNGLDTNILGFAITQKEIQKLSELNNLTFKVYNSIESDHDYWVSKTTVFTKDYLNLIQDFCQKYKIEIDTDHLHLIRITLMNPFLVSKESSVNHIEEFCTVIERTLG